MTRIMTRIERIVDAYFVPHGHQISDDDIEYVMEFLKVMLMYKGKFKCDIRGEKK